MSESSLRQSVADVLGLLYVTTVIVTTASYILILIPESWDAKVWLTGTGSPFLLPAALVPASSFALASYLYEGLALRTRMTRAFWWRSLLTAFLLLIPPVILVTRFSVNGDVFEWIKGGSVAALLLFLMQVTSAGRKRRESDGLLPRLLGHARYVMWDAWRLNRMSEDAMLRDGDVDVEGIKRERQDLMQDPEGLLEFQSTLTCPFLDSRDSVVLLTANWPARPLNVLDIGGGDGRYTAALLGMLEERGFSVKSIKMVDPVDWHTAYRENLDAKGIKAPISFVDDRFDRFQASDKYDLVIASHSLYATMEANDVEDLRMAAIVNRLMTLKGDGGRVVVLLASEVGAAYQFKRVALQHLYGIQVPYAKSEALDAAVQPYGTRHQSQVVDNVFRLTGEMKQFRAGEPKPLREWLSYFLRVDLDRLSTESVSHLVELLCCRLTRVDALDEAGVARLKQIPEMPITRDDYVLGHKVVVRVLS
jgi:hypothetical protein